MAYHVQIVEAVESYVAGIEGLSDNGKREIIEGCTVDLQTRADYFHERYPLEHESYRFSYEFSLIDGSLIYSFRFIVDGSQMAVGVVRVIYVDYETLSLSPDQ
jgi:hypothetical protein